MIPNTIKYNTLKNIVQQCHKKTKSSKVEAQTIRAIYDNMLGSEEEKSDVKKNFTKCEKAIFYITPRWLFYSCFFYKIRKIVSEKILVKLTNEINTDEYGYRFQWQELASDKTYINVLNSIKNTISRIKSIQSTLDESKKLLKELQPKIKDKELSSDIQKELIEINLFTHGFSEFIRKIEVYPLLRDNVNSDYDKTICNLLVDVNNLKGRIEDLHEKAKSLKDCRKEKEDFDKIDEKIDDLHSDTKKKIEKFDAVEEVVNIIKEELKKKEKEEKLQKLKKEKLIVEEEIVEIKKRSDSFEKMVKYYEEKKLELEEKNKEYDNIEKEINDVKVKIHENKIQLENLEGEKSNYIEKLKDEKEKIDAESIEYSEKILLLQKSNKKKFKLKKSKEKNNQEIEELQNKFIINNKKANELEDKFIKNQYQDNIKKIELEQIELGKSIAPKKQQLDNIKNKILQLKIKEKNLPVYQGMLNETSLEYNKLEEQRKNLDSEISILQGNENQKIESKIEEKKEENIKIIENFEIDDKIIEIEKTSLIELNEEKKIDSEKEKIIQQSEYITRINKFKRNLKVHFKMYLKMPFNGDNGIFQNLKVFNNSKEKYNLYTEIFKDLSQCRENLDSLKIQFEEERKALRGLNYAIKQLEALEGQIDSDKNIEGVSLEIKYLKEKKEILEDFLKRQYHFITTAEDIYSQHDQCFKKNLYVDSKDKDENQIKKEIINKKIDEMTLKNLVNYQSSYSKIESSMTQYCNEVIDYKASLPDTLKTREKDDIIVKILSEKEQALKEEILSFDKVFPKSNGESYKLLQNKKLVDEVIAPIIRLISPFVPISDKNSKMSNAEKWVDIINNHTLSLDKIQWDEKIGKAGFDNIALEDWFSINSVYKHLSILIREKVSLLKLFKEISEFDIKTKPLNFKLSELSKLDKYTKYDISNYFLSEPKKEFFFGSRKAFREYEKILDGTEKLSKENENKFKEVEKQLKEYDQLLNDILSLDDNQLKTMSIDLKLLILEILRFLNGALLSLTHPGKEFFPFNFRAFLETFKVPKWADYLLRIISKIKARKLADMAIKKAFPLMKTLYCYYKPDDITWSDPIQKSKNSEQYKETVIQMINNLIDGGTGWLLAKHSLARIGYFGTDVLKLINKFGALKRSIDAVEYNSKLSEKERSEQKKELINSLEKSSAYVFGQFLIMGKNLVVEILQCDEYVSLINKYENFVKANEKGQFFSEQLPEDAIQWFSDVLKEVEKTEKKD